MKKVDSFLILAIILDFQDYRVVTIGGIQMPISVFSIIIQTSAGAGLSSVSSNYLVLSGRGR